MCCRVIGNLLPDLAEEDLQRLLCCLKRIAESLQNIGREVSVSAVCDVQADTGIPGYPITGQVVFTQSVNYSLLEQHNRFVHSEFRLQNKIDQRIT